MWNNIKERIFPFIIALSALSVSASAAFYSITGLSMLFAGAALAVTIMATSLEISKLVIASLLYQYWSKLNKILRAYLTIASIVLILLTSAGIYGFLSAAYSTVYNKSVIIDQNISSLETKKGLYEQTRDNYLIEKKSISTSTSELRGALSKGSTTQYTDSRGNLTIKANNQGRKSFEKQLASTSLADEKLTAKLDIINDSIFSLQKQILEIKNKSAASSELGPLKYLSKLTGVSMDRIINWFLLVIIFVFDPLAIALIIAANFAFAQIKPTLPKIENTPKETEIIPPTPHHIPVFVEPSTGKLFFEEPDVNLDLNNDGIVEEKEIQEVFDKADINNDKIIDENESKNINMDNKTREKLNQLNQSLEELSKLNDENNYDFQWKKEKTAKEIENIKNLLLKQFNKEDENTITYF